ncbi:MAG TPA: TonB-dependent receptor [Vicinamibacterales bacterium]|nr:TonB-dependent receptor [Vicinamibacterales bacterium]
MNRLVWIVLLCVMAARPALAQVQGGTISGTVKDAQGGVLPGATVTAQGADAALTTVTDVAGRYRFLDVAPGVYSLKVELSSFSSVTGSVTVAVGRSVDFSPALPVARGSEAVTVTAPLVDRTITGTAINFGSDELKTIPTSRDPFALARTVPGVMLDQVNVGGNETGQQAMVLGKGARQQDTSWTIDGIEVTDMGAPGQSPTYYNFDNFEEIQISTAGQDIRSRTGGIGINLVTRRGTNQFHGNIRSYFSNDGMESANVPDELKALTPAVTPETADHTIQNSDYGFDFGGPVLKDKAWFYASLAKQDIRIYKRSTKSIDKSILRNPQVKVNWQATEKDMINFLFFNGYKIKDGRSNPTNASQFEEPEATHHQDNAYSDSSPFHGLWKIQDDRVLSPSMFLSAKYSYYNTGFTLTPQGGMDAQAGRNIEKSLAYGSTVRTAQVRPQHFLSADMNEFVHAFGLSHDVKYGVGFRHVTNLAQVEWPGNGILAIEQAGATQASGPRAQVFREVNGGNTVNYFDFFVGDTVSFNRATVDAALRFDRQWGNALASSAEGSKAYPNLVPAVEFPGYDSLFTWNNFSPRVGLSYAIDPTGKTVARVSFSRFAGQLAQSTVGTENPTTGSTPGSITYVWNDANGDHLAQTQEVDTTQRISSAGIDATNPAFITTPNKVDRDLKAPVTSSFVAGVERELMPNVTVRVDYTYSRTSNLFGNMTGNITPRNNVTLAEYVPATASPVTGTLPDGTPYSINVFAPPATATNVGFLTTNVPGYYSDYHGFEVNLVKRLADKWMGRLTMGFNNAREHFSDPAGVYDTNGNPTATPTEPLEDGGRFAPTASLSTGILMDAKWQFNANGMYQAPYGIELAANVFGRQGYPFPIYRASVPLTAPGATSTLDTLNVLVAPIDTFRFDSVWDTDLRIAREFHVRAGTESVNLRFAADIFNLFNANTELVRNGNIGSSTSFNVLSKNLSPRILRLGLVVGF